MTGRDLRNLRQSLGLNRVEFARAVGYQGSDRNIARLIRKYEEDTIVPATVQARIAIHKAGGILAGRISL